MARLTLDPTGIKRPLDMGEPTPRDAEPVLAIAAASPTIAPAPNPPRRRPPALAPAPAPAAPLSAAASEQATDPFYGAGRRIQTSLAVDITLGIQLEDLARAANVSFSALFIAVVHAGLPRSSQDVQRQTILERAEHARADRMERNIRLPEQLRARLDQLTAAVLEVSRRATRADLVNAILRTAIPQRAEDAAELVDRHRARLELLALPGT